MEPNGSEEAHVRQLGDPALWNERRFEDLLAGVDVIVWEADAETFDFTFVSRRAEEILGYPTARWFEEGFWANTIHPDDRERAIASCKEATDRNEDHMFEYRAIAADGREVWLRDIVRVHIDLESETKMLRGVMIDITERKSNEERDRRDHEAARQSLSLLRATLESTADGILVVDLDGRITVFNQKFVEMWRLDRELVERRDDEAALSAVLHQLRDPDAFLDKVQKLYADLRSTSFDVLHFKDGRVFERYSQPQWVGGEARGRVWSFRDVTTRVMAEERLRESEERFRRAFEDSGVGMSLVGLDGRFMRVNREFCRITGRDGDELVGMSFEDVTHPEDRGRGWEAADRLLDGEWDTSRREKRYVRPDGTVVWGQIISSLVRSAEGKPRYFVSQVQDISERRKRDDRFRALVQHSSDVICVIDSEGVVTYVTPSIETLLGYQPDEILGRSGFEFIHPEDDDAAHERLQEALEAPGRTVKHERVVRHRDGSDVHLEVVLTNLLDDPNVTGIVANVRDITERKLTEIALRAANAVQAELAAILYSSADAIIGSTLDGSISSWNDAAEKLFGYSREEIVGKSVGFLIPGHPSFDRARITELVQDGKAEFESKGRRKDGSHIDASVTLSPIKSESGEIIGISGSVRDVGERRALEEQLREAQKMEAVARLAGGVSHDFNNLLTAILGNCEMLLDELELSAEVREQISEIKEAAEIGGSVTSQLLDISRRRVVVEETISLVSVVEQMDGVLCRLLGEDIELFVHMPDEEIHVLGDAGQIEQVILNLAVNARDAMPEGGRFTVTLETVEVSSAGPLEGFGLKAAHYAVLTATDTGFGMSPEIKERLFEPFFTTKEGTYATGLGLSTVYQIVSHMGGSVSVASSPGAGATFRIFLPVGSEPVRAEISPETSRLGVARGSILLVEDDDRVRAVARRILEQGGYSVTEAIHALDALHKVESAEQPFELLVTDIVMPGRDGPDLAQELTARFPALRVLLISGYSGDALTGPPSLADGFLAKPFRPSDLLEKVAQILESASGGSS